MLQVIGLTLAPVMTIMAFVVGVKMEQGRQWRTITRLRFENEDLKHRLKESQWVIQAYEDAVKQNPYNDTYIIQEVP